MGEQNRGLQKFQTLLNYLIKRRVLENDQACRCNTLSFGVFGLFGTHRLNNTVKSTNPNLFTSSFDLKNRIKITYPSLWNLLRICFAGRGLLMSEPSGVWAETIF